MAEKIENLTRNSELVKQIRIMITSGVRAFHSKQWRTTCRGDCNIGDAILTSIHAPAKRYIDTVGVATGVRRLRPASGGLSRPHIMERVK